MVVRLHKMSVLHVFIHISAKGIFPHCGADRMHYTDRQFYLLGTFLNTEVIESERRITSHILPLHALCSFACCRCLSVLTCVHDRLQKLCRDWRCVFVLRCSPEVPTRVAFISLVGCKGPLQRREIRADPHLLVFKWAWWIYKMGCIQAQWHQLKGPILHRGSFSLFWFDN